MGLLLLSPAILTFKLNAPEPESEMARQFNDDPIINYGIWGFIAGLSDYFIRNGLSPPPPLQQRRPGSISETSITRTRRRRSKKRRMRRRCPRWRPCRKRRKLRIPWRLLLLRNPKLNQKFLLMLKSRFKPSI